MLRQREQLQLLRQQTMPREEVLVVELLFQIRFHQELLLESSELSAFMVVHQGLSWSPDGVMFLMRFCLRGSPSRSHSSSPSQQSRVKRMSRPRRPSRHPSRSYAALVVPMFQSHRGRRHSGGDHVHCLDHRVRLQ